MAAQSLYYSLDSSDSNSSAISNEMPVFRSSPDVIPTFSPSANTSEISDRPDSGDRFLYSPDGFEPNSPNGPYSAQSTPSHFIPFLSPSEAIGSYIEPPSLTTPSSSSSDGGHIPYNAVYRLMPPSQSSSMSDISIPTNTVFSGEDYRSLERIRSPVSYF